MSLLIMFCIGFVAAVIDVVPMILQKLDKSACISAAVHWIVLGFIIPSVEWPMLPAVKGIIIAFMTMLPVGVLVAKEDAKALIPMTVFSILLGAGVGYAGFVFIG